MVRIAWPLFVACLVLLGVHYLPWPVRSQSQDSPRIVSLTCSSAPAAQPSYPSEDTGSPRILVDAQPAPVPPPPPKATVPSAGLPTWEEAIEKVEKKLIDSFKGTTTSQYVAQTGAQTPPAPIPPPIVTDAPPPLPSPAPPAVKDVPPPAPGDVPPPPVPNVVPPQPKDFSPPAPKDVTPPPPATPPIPVAPEPAPPTPPLETPKRAPAPFYPPQPTESPRTPKLVVPMKVNIAEDAPAEKLISSPWTFHLEIVDGKNLITAKVGKTVQFRVNCDKVDIQSPHGTIQAQGNVKVTSMGLQVTGEKMTIQLQEDSMVLEGAAQMKCQRDGQEIDLRSDRFSLRLSEIQGQTSSAPSPNTSASSTSQAPPATPGLTRPPIVDVSRDFP